MASFTDLVLQVRQFAPYFASVFGAANPELAEEQLNGPFPSCIIIPSRYVAQPQTNLTAVFREVVESYECLVALDNTPDRVGASSSAVAFDAVFDALRSALEGWVPLNPDNTSDYLYGFAFVEAESVLVNRARSFWSFKYQATRVYDESGSFLQNPIYLANLNVVSTVNPPMTLDVVLIDQDTGVVTDDLSLSLNT